MIVQFVGWKAFILLSSETFHWKDLFDWKPIEYRNITKSMAVH